MKLLQAIKTSMKMFCVLLLSIGIGFLLLLTVFLIPTDQINVNVADSAEIFVEEGVYPQLSKLCTSHLDNFTDSIILMNSAYDGEADLVDKALIVYRKRYEEMDPVDSLIQYYNGTGDEEKLTELGYTRYWHGYLLIQKPLLTILSYGEIRIFNFVVQLLLTCVVIYLMCKRNLKKYSVLYLLMLALLCPITLYKSLQYSSIFYIFTIASIVLLMKKWKITQAYYIFLLIGIATAYFDFLTYPIASFGIPITIYVCVTDTKTETAFYSMLNYLKLFCSWVVGYAGMWSGKWILAELLTEENVITSAIAQLVKRIGFGVGATETNVSVIAVLYKNILAFIKNPAMIVAVLLCMSVAYIIIKKKRLDAIKKNVILFGWICVLPFAWYIFARNHVAVHAGMTYKALIVTAFAGMCMLVRIYEESKEQIDVKNS